MRKIIMTTAAVSLAGLALFGCSVEDPTAQSGTVNDSSTSADAAPADDPGATYDNPSKGDFNLTVKTLTKECFGSAGCIVTFRIKVSMDDTVSLDPDKTYEVTYRIRGGDEPLTNTLEVTGDDYSTDKEEIIQTSSSSDKLTAAVTDVEEV